MPISHDSKYSVVIVFPECSNGVRELWLTRKGTCSGVTRHGNDGVFLDMHLGGFVAVR